MSHSAGVPLPPDFARRLARRPGARAWLASLPAMIGARLEEWRLVPDLVPGRLPWTGPGGIAFPVLPRDPGSAAAEPAVLKVPFPDDAAGSAPPALRLWAGTGAVRLLASDAGSAALLLERLDQAHTLGDIPLAAAAAGWGNVLRRLSLVPDGRAEWREFEHIAARAEQWSDELPESWERLARPFPRWLLEAALEVCQTRGAVGRRSGRDVLVHTDLHFENVLLRRGDRETDSYAAIDPKPMIGEAEFAVAPLLWNRLAELDRRSPAAALLARCRDFSAAAGLDPEVARQWSLAREVENALGHAALGHGADASRSLWVASTLAGRTLADLPAPHSLPAPRSLPDPGAPPARR